MNKTKLAFVLLVALVTVMVLVNKRHRPPPVPPPGSQPSAAQADSHGNAALVARWVSRPGPMRPAPPATLDLEPTAVPEEKTATRLSDLLEQVDTLSRPTAETLARYVERNGPSAESLLTAYRQSKDTNWLFRAATEFGHDPRVQLEMLSLDLDPEQRLEWLEAFQQTAPDNSLADYLAAAHHLRQGEVEQALSELAAGNQKKEFNAFLADSMQNTEELYIESGTGELEAKAKAFLDTEFHYLGMLKGFSQDLQAYQTQLRQAGRAAEADELAVLGMQFAQHLSLGDGNRTILNQLLGLSIEQSFLNGLDPDGTYADLPMPVSEMRQAVVDQSDSLRELTGLFLQTLPTADERTLSWYFDRIKIFGEYQALLWLRGQQPDLVRTPPAR